MFDISYLTDMILQLYKRSKILRGIFDSVSTQESLKKINILLAQNKTWKNISLVSSLNKQRSLLVATLNEVQVFFSELNDAKTLLELATEENNLEILPVIYTELKNIEDRIRELEFRKFFHRQQDRENCYIDIQAGSGGIEAQDWAYMLSRMYLRWAEKKRFFTEIISESLGEKLGIKCTTILVSGEYAFGWLRTETGIHRLVRKSPFDSGRRRHTSFSSAFIYPEVKDNIEIELNSIDLRIDVYRSSGAGGQHVNRTESAVRITHLPTGTVTQCQNARSQHKNKEQALKQMKAKLYNLELKKRNADKQTQEKNKPDIAWGRQIRSYVLDDSRIKDLRTGIETRNIQAVLNGEIDLFLEENLKARL
ncbi:MAG: peptide chain release factor 2 [Candidatus Dasytiphilus stammeri]